MLNLSEISLSDEQTEVVSRKMAEVLKEPTYRYPWNTLEGELERRCMPGIPLIAYGSLINKSSTTAQMLSEQSLGTRQPGVAFGVRRLFNYELPLNIGRYSPPTHPLARGALNVLLTDKVEDVINGIVMKVSITDIPVLRKLEKGYDLVPVACLKWNEFERPPFLAYILCCPCELREGGRFTNDKVTPHLEYYLLCREGASKVGEKFLNVWLKTTYLANAVTLVAEWETTGFLEMDSTK